MSGDGILLRLLLLHEATVAWADLSAQALLQHAQAQVPYLFTGATLSVQQVRDSVDWPDRGIGPDGYGGYFAGPPEPLYLTLVHPQLADPQELRLAALFMEHLLAALRGAGYREELERQARTDWLSGLPNRRALERYSKAGLPTGWSLGVFDLDNLKHVNDTQGHLAGDRLIRRFARTLARLAQSAGGQAFHLSGDEFVILIPQKSRQRIEAGLRGFFYSAGYADADEGNFDWLCQLADDRMYRQKRSK